MAKGGDKAFRGIFNLIAAMDALDWKANGDINTDLTKFISSFFSLFGECQRIDETVMSLINDAVKKAKAYEFRGTFDSFIETEVTKIKNAINVAKVSLDTLGIKYDKNDDNHLLMIWRIRLSIRQQMYPALKRLARKINKKTNRNFVIEKIGCFYLVELYTKIMSVWEMIVIRYISMLPYDNDPWFIEARRDYPGYLTDTRSGTRKMLAFLHDPSKRSFLMAYFNGRDYPILNAYMETILKIPRPNAFPAARYCINPWGNDYLQYNWFPDRKWRHIFGPSSDTYRRCKWEINSHGNDLYSILNKNKCPWAGNVCNHSLSYGPYERNHKKYTIALLKAYDPVIWQLRRDPTRAGGYE